MIKVDIQGVSFFMVSLPLDDIIYSEMTAWLDSVAKKYSIKRQHNYLAGRYCIKKALENYNFRLDSLDKLKNGAPKWPDGFSGSISHTKGYAIGAISNQYQSIGIDIETIIKKKRLDKIREAFMSDVEKSQFGHSDIEQTIIFSAKEALYKVLNPLTDIFFGFEEATMKSISDGNFLIELHTEKDKLALFNGEYKGSYWVTNEYVVSLICVSE